MRQRTISRRRFIQLAATAALLGACRPARPTEAPGPSPSATVPATPTPAPTPTATRTPIPTASPSPTATAVPTVTPTHAPSAAAQVAVARVGSYDRTRVRQAVRSLLDGIGGLAGLVRPGDRVALKVNLTGGSHFSPPPGVPATESYMTHPEVVRALAESLRDAGARELYIVEALFDDGSFQRYGYLEVAQAVGATLVDLNQPQPYGDFAVVRVGPGWFIYQQFTMNRLLQEVNTFISVAKLKAHCRCGVTLAMKNLVGLVPTAAYRLSASDWWRSALHGANNDQARTRLPRVVVDLNRARPIHLALIDGIRSGDAGEVPRGAFAPLAPGVLVASRDPVAADAVASAIMGFDPAASYPNPPFVNADNHLELASQMGLGTHRLDRIQVAGERIADVRQPFRPCWSEEG